MEPQIPAPGPLMQDQCRGNQACPNLFPAAPNPQFPDFKSVEQAANVRYRPVFKNHVKAEQFRQYMISKSDVLGTFTTDIPDLDVEGEGHKWIERLHKAVYDFSEILEAKEAEYYKKLTKDYHNEGAMHWMLWKLLSCIVEAQHGVNLLPPWYTPDGPCYRHYPSFADRFNDVVAGLKESKSTVVSLFKSDEFPARLAWNPPKEYKRKVDNLGQNENKSGWMSARHAVAEKLGVHRNENGEFEDKDGNIIAENTSFKTELAVSRSTALKRRPGSNKAPAISKLVPPTIPPGTPQLLDPVPIGSPLPEEHVNDPGPPSLDTSKKRTKTKRKARSKISKGAEVVQHPRRAAMSSSSLPRVLEAKASSVAQASTALQTVPQRYPSQPLPSPQQVQVSQQAYMERQQHHIFQQAPMPYPYLPSQAQPQLPMTDAQYGPPRDTITQGNNKKRRLEYEPWPGLVSNTPSPWTGYTPTPDGYAYQSEFSPQQFTVQSQQYNTLAGQVPDPINDPFWVPDLGHFGPQE